MAEPRRLSELAAAAEAVMDLPSGDLVVALSGGADSAALVWLCRRLGRRVRAVHVHHGLAASDLLAGAAAGVAEAVDVDVDVRKVDIGSGPSLEAQARRVRYEAFTEAADPGEWVLTAHTSDDQAETMLDHLLRGSGLDGLRGIPSRRFPFARPLLQVSRSTTREIATLAGLPWQDDPLNLSPEPLRNRIRTSLIPELEKYNRRIRRSLATTAHLVARDVEYLQGSISAPIDMFEGSAAIAAAVLSTADPSPAARLTRRFLAVAGLAHASPEAVEGTLAVARGERERLEPGGGLVVRRREALVVAETGSRAPAEPVPLEPSGPTSFGRWRLDSYMTDTPPAAMPIGAGWMVADADAVGPLQVEASARHPEVLAALASAGVRKPDRPHHPVVVAADGPVWIPGIRRLGIGWADAATRRYLVIRSWTERRWRR